MPVIIFHPRTIAKLPIGPKQIDYYDDTLPNFGLRVSPGLTFTWFAILRVNGIVRRHKIGTYPNQSLAAARRAARQLLAQAELGTDPSKEKYRRRKAMKVSELKEIYIKALAKTTRAWKQVEAVLDNDVIPRFRAYKIDEPTKSEIIELLEKLDERAPTAARRALEATRQMYNFAIKRGLATENPAALLDAPSPKHNRKRLLTMDELTKLIEELANEPYSVAAAILMILLSLSRQAEILSLRRLTIAQKQSYFIATDTKNKKDHANPTTGLMFKLIAKQELMFPVKSGDFLFPSAVKANTHLSGSHLLRRLKAILERAGISKAWLHDLRRAGATHLARLGTRKEVITSLLNHDGGSVTDIYNLWAYWPERRAALEKWEGELLSYPEIKAAVDNILAKES
jgi:site-specific recombinase XerD